MRPPSSRSFYYRIKNELDLTPVMGLFVGLVPFLLTVAVFTKVTLISVPLPRVAQTEEEIQKVDQERFFLKVHIVDDKTRRQARRHPGFVVDTNSFRSGPQFLPLTPENEYDYRSLNALILEVKKMNEEEKKITLIPGDFISYEVLVRTLDATRETLPELTGGEPDITGVELFPDVILDKVDS